MVKLPRGLDRPKVSQSGEEFKERTEPQVNVTNVVGLE